jgi:hypothetical protein
MFVKIDRDRGSVTWPSGHHRFAFGCDRGLGTGLGERELGIVVDREPDREQATADGEHDGSLQIDGWLAELAHQVAADSGVEADIAPAAHATVTNEDVEVNRSEAGEVMLF